MELFGIINENDINAVEATVLNDEMIQIKNYIDENYPNISSTYEIAEKFY